MGGYKLSIPAAIRVPVSELESPKLKTAEKSKFMDFTRVKEKKMMTIMSRTHVLVAITVED